MAAIRTLAQKKLSVEVCSATRFVETAHRERVRTDRTKSPVSVITLKCKSDVVRRVIDILSVRLRVTDLIGEMDDKTVGALLPDTQASGAFAVASDVESILKSEGTQVETEVYCYDPGRLPGNGNFHDVAKPLEVLFQPPLNMFKRVLDITLSSIALLFLSPIFAIVALAIKLTSSGPVFFTQWRDGLGARPFRIYKFRTMAENAEGQKAKLMALNEMDGAAFKIKNDPRITSIGKFLRATSIDELPQLLNVLIGDMSLVGPRPLPCSESSACMPWQRRRLDVPPGMTCTWQVSGRSNISFAEWMRMDLRYIESTSFTTDFRLLLRTLPAVIAQRGAH